MNSQPYNRGRPVLRFPFHHLYCGPRTLPSGAFIGLFAAFLLCLFAAGCATPNDTLWPTEYADIYSRPLLSPGAQFAATPPAVQNTIRAQTGSAGIANIAKQVTPDLTFYRVEFVNYGLFPPLYIAADGSVLDPHLNVLIPAATEKVSSATGAPVTALMLSTLPPPVVRSIQLRAADAEVANIVKEPHGDQTTYFITFKDDRHPPLHLASDGTPLPDSGR